jgi:hypothetical protein
MSGSVELVPPSGQEGRILLLRGTRVMLDGDLAALYGVDTKVLNQAVRRNLERFPADFMFQLTAEEHAALRSQSVTLESGRGKHAKYLPLAFTEQGVAMLSSVLRSPRAIRVNIELMRAFVRLRAMAIAHHELARKVEGLERKYDGQLKVVFQALRQIMSPAGAKQRKIGFRAGRS